MRIKKNRICQAECGYVKYPDYHALITKVTVFYEITDSPQQKEF